MTKNPKIDFVRFLKTVLLESIEFPMVDLITLPVIRYIDTYV